MPYVHTVATVVVHRRSTIRPEKVMAMEHQDGATKAYEGANSVRAISFSTGPVPTAFEISSACELTVAKHDLLHTFLPSFLWPWRGV